MPPPRRGERERAREKNREHRDRGNARCVWVPFGDKGADLPAEPRGLRRAYRRPVQRRDFKVNVDGSMGRGTEKREEEKANEPLLACTSPRHTSARVLAWQRTSSLAWTHGLLLTVSSDAERADGTKTEERRRRKGDTPYNKQGLYAAWVLGCTVRTTDLSGARRGAGHAPADVANSPCRGSSRSQRLKKEDMKQRPRRGRTRVGMPLPAPPVSVQGEEAAPLASLECHLSAPFLARARPPTVQ